MATDKQIAANRLNAQKSTGPKTPEGRAAVRLNGVEHGLYAETLVLPGEALVVQLAMAMWRLRRLYHAEVAYCAKERKFLAKLTSEKQLDDHTLTGMAVHANRDTVSTFRCQEAALERTFYRALHELQRPHAKRPAKLALNPHLAAADTQEPENHPPAESNPPSEPTSSPQNTIQIAPLADDMQ